MTKFNDDIIFVDLMSMEKWQLARWIIKTMDNQAKIDYLQEMKDIEETE